MAEDEIEAGLRRAAADLAAYHGGDPDAYLPVVRQAMMGEVAPYRRLIFPLAPVPPTRPATGASHERTPDGRTNSIRHNRKNIRRP